jgi:hypothetical protein
VDLISRMRHFYHWASTCGRFTEADHPFNMWGVALQEVNKNLIVLSSYLISNTYSDWRIGILGLLAIFRMVIPNSWPKSVAFWGELMFVATGLSGFALLILESRCLASRKR